MASAVVLETYPIKAFFWSDVYVLSKNKNIYRPEEKKSNLWRPRNRPFPSSPGRLYQNEVRCSTFLVEMSFICMRMKNHFHIKD